MMTIPEIKKYLGSRVCVRHLSKARLGNALKANQELVLFVPNDCDVVSYVAFVNEKNLKIVVLLVVERLMTPDKLDILMKDVRDSAE